MTYRVSQSTLKIIYNGEEVVLRLKVSGSLEDYWTRAIFGFPRLTSSSTTLTEDQLQEVVFYL